MPVVQDRLQTEWMSPTEVAAILRVHRTTVLRWIRTDQLPSLHVAQTIRISVDAVIALIERDQSVDDLAGDLADWLSHRGAEKAPTLCPRCAVRSVDKTSKQGWCTSCTTEAQIAEDEQRERERARKRRWWQENGTEWRNATRNGVKQDA